MSETPVLCLRPLTGREAALLEQGVTLYRGVLAQMVAQPGMDAYARERLTELETGATAVADAVRTRTWLIVAERPARAVRLGLDQVFLHLVATDLPTDAAQPLPEHIEALVRLCADLDAAAEQAGFDWE